MISSAKKRRNQSYEVSNENKMTLRKQNQPFDSNPHAFKDRPLNRILAHSETDQQPIRNKLVTPFRYNQQLSAINDKFSFFSSKIKSLLKKQDQKYGKQNCSYQVPKVQRSPEIVRRSELLPRECTEKIQKQGSLPYFIQCFKRRNHITTEACMHINTSLAILKQFAKNIHSTKPKVADLKIPAESENRKTIVFDMDETLIHTNEIMVKGYQLKVPFKSIQGRVISGYVHVRPHAKQIIKNLSRHFDIVVFTAGNQCYADPILDYLDPEKCIKHRFYRESCTMVNNQLFVKDLRILGRKLENVVLVDNAPYSYLMQLSNGIPILNYLKGKDDDQLVKLEGYLMSLLEVEDVRTVNDQTFRLQEYINYDRYEKLVMQLYGKWL